MSDIITGNRLRVLAFGVNTGTLETTLLYPSPKRIQRLRSKGWRLPANTTIITRPGRFGNPFPVDVFGRERALELYRLWIDGKWHKDMYPYSSEYENRYGHLDALTIRLLLAGRDVACFCRVDEACHGDILLEIANE